MTIWKPQYNLGSLVSTESKPFSHASIITKILKSTETDSAAHVPRNFCFTQPIDFWCLVFSQFSRSVVSDSLQPHESQHARPPCPSPTPGVYSNSSPLSRWCHPTISSSVVPFSSCPQYLPTSGSFPMSQLFAWGGQSIGVPASESVLPMNTQDWSALGWTGWISLQSSLVFSKGIIF